MMANENSDSRKVALITGSAKRIGRELSLHLASSGWSIAIHYNHSDKAAKKLLKELDNKYPEQKFELFQSNLQNQFAVESLIPEIIKVYGRLDLLINNASVFEASTIKNTHFELLDKEMMINYRAPFLLMRDFARYLDQGVIVNFVDTRITGNSSEYAAYTLSKKILWELTKMAAVEFSPGFRVNAIAPGITLPPEDKDESYLWKLSKKIPIQRPTGIQPILKSLDYILDNEHLTGQLLFCDGGENLV